MESLPNIQKFLVLGASIVEFIWSDCGGLMIKARKLKIILKFWIGHELFWTGYFYPLHWILPQAGASSNRWLNHTLRIYFTEATLIWNYFSFPKLLRDHCSICGIRLKEMNSNVEDGIGKPLPYRCRENNVNITTQSPGVKLDSRELDLWWSFLAGV